MISFSSTLPFGSPVGRNNTALLGLDPGDPDVLAILENDYIKNLLSSLLPPVKQSLSDLLKERALDLVTETADLACIGDFQAVNDFARGNIDFTTTVERFFKQADIDLMLGATVTALTNYFTRGALGTYAIPETLAVAKASKFLRKDFPNLCTNFFSKKAGKGTAGNLKAAGEAKPRLGTSGYKGGSKWTDLKPVNTPETTRQIGKINKQAFGGGEVRTDGEHVFRFDPAHKTAKVHMERYKKIRNNHWRADAEIDPQTGEPIAGSEAKLAKKVRDITW